MSTVEAPKPRWNEGAREFALRRDAALIRGPIEWSWDVTNQCMGHCLHCFNRSGVVARDELRDEEARDLARQIIGMQPLGICFCGGEPLLRADTILPLAREMSDAGINVNMVTNGQVMTEGLATTLVKSGIRMVQVSLDGAQAESHDRLRGVVGSFDRAVKAIQTLRAADSIVGVAFTPTSFNIHEWSAVYELCKSLGVFELRIQPIMPIGECALAYDELAPSEEQYRELVEAYKRMVLTPKGATSVQWGDPVDHLIRFGQFYSMISYTMHITADGFLEPSVYLPVVLGNVRRHRLDEYWRAGLATAWQLRLVRELAYRVRSNRDFTRVRPHPFFDAPVDLDLVDRSPEEVERLTDIVLNFVEKVAPDPSRPPDPWLWSPGSPRVRAFLKSCFGDEPGGATTFTGRKGEST